MFSPVETVEGSEEDVFALLHGLYWLTVCSDAGADRYFALRERRSKFRCHDASRTQKPVLKKSDMTTPLQYSAVAGVGSVEVDLDTKLVCITGERLDKAALREAIHEAGYEVEGGE